MSDEMVSLEKTSDNYLLELIDYWEWFIKTDIEPLEEEVANEFYLWWSTTPFTVDSPLNQEELRDLFNVGENYIDWVNWYRGLNSQLTKVNKELKVLKKDGYGCYVQSEAQKMHEQFKKMTTLIIHLRVNLKTIWKKLNGRLPPYSKEEADRTFSRHPPHQGE